MRGVDFVHPDSKSKPALRIIKLSQEKNRQVCLNFGTDKCFSDSAAIHPITTIATLLFYDVAIGSIASSVTLSVAGGPCDKSLPDVDDVFGVEIGFQTLERLLKPGPLGFVAAADLEDALIQEPFGGFCCVVPAIVVLQVVMRGVCFQQEGLEAVEFHRHPATVNPQEHHILLVIILRLRLLNVNARCALATVLLSEDVECLDWTTRLDLENEVIVVD